MDLAQLFHSSVGIYQAARREALEDVYEKLIPCYFVESNIQYYNTEVAAWNKLVVFLGIHEDVVPEAVSSFDKVEDMLTSIELK